MAVKLLTHVTSAPCITKTEKVLRLSWRIRVMRLIRGIPVPRINLRARINHANRSDSLGRLQATVTLGAMQTLVTMASPATGYPAGISLLFHDREGSGTASSTRSFAIIEILRG